MTTAEGDIMVMDKRLSLDPKAKSCILQDGENRALALLRRQDKTGSLMAALEESEMLAQEIVAAVNACREAGITTEELVKEPHLVARALRHLLPSRDAESTIVADAEQGMRCGL